MGGFDADAARSEFDIETALTPLVVLAVGRRDPDAEPLAARERRPRAVEAGRSPVGFRWASRMRARSTSRAAGSGVVVAISDVSSGRR
jgi:hypothetical protein